MDPRPLEALHQALRTGELSATSLMRSCAEQYTRNEALTHAYKTWDGERARQIAAATDILLKAGRDLGPLMGIPMSVKDLFGVPGLPTFAGSSSPLPRSWEEPGPLMTAVLSQLALVTGKTHTVEFAFGGMGVNANWGTPVNPWDAENHRIPGGSSSGAGVSLSQGSAYLALGSDTAGSVRIPASLTGNVGLKVTQGRWPCTGIVPLSSTFDTPGILARSVADALFGFKAIEAGLYGLTPRIEGLDSLAGLRFGIPEHFFWDDASPSIVAAVQTAIRDIEALGGQVRKVELPHCVAVFDLFMAGGLAASELSAFLKTTMPEKIDALDPVVKMRIEGAESLTSVDYLRRHARFMQAAQEAAQFFNGIDVIVTPTVAVSPPKLADITESDAYRKANMLVLRNTCIANLMGLSALSMPIAKDDQRMPVGLQLICGPRQEEKLLAIAAYLEHKWGTPADVLGQPPLLQ